MIKNMPSVLYNIKNISLYFLPLAAFFLLISSAGTNFFLLSSVLMSIIYCVKNRDYKILLKENIFKIFFTLYFLFVISSYYSIANTEDLISILKKYIKFIYIPFLYYLIKIQKNEDKILKFFISGASIILIFSYIKYFSIINFDYFYDFLKYLNIANTQDKIINTNASIFQNYIIQGIILSFYSFLCLYLAKKKNSILFYFLSFFAFVNVLFLNDSRTAYIIIIILSLFSFLKIIINYKGRLFFIALCILLVTTLYSNNLSNRITIIQDDAELISKNNYNSSLGHRYLWSKISANSFIDAPFLGHGAGSFKEISKKYFEYNTSVNFSYYVTNNPHSEFLSIITQLGSVGLCLFLGILFFLFKDSKKCIFCRGVFIVVLFSSIFNSAFYDNMLGLFLTIIVSLFYNLKSSVEHKKV